MTQFVRVRDVITGHHVTVSRGLVESDPKRWSELKQDATDVNGRPLPPKHKRTQSTEATAPAEAPEATTTEATKEANS